MSRRGRPRQLSGLRHPVADAELGQDDLGIVGVFLDLLAQLADIDAQVLRLLGVRRAPDGGQQLAMRQTLPA